VASALGRALGKDQDANHNGHCKHAGSRVPADRHASLRHRFVEQVARHRAQRAGQDEGGPEEPGLGDGGEEVQTSHHHQRSAEHRNATQVAQSRIIAAQSPSAVPSVWENMMVTQ
jgi:hypothetical protein